MANCLCLNNYAEYKYVNFVITIFADILQQQNKILFGELTFSESRKQFGSNAESDE